MTSSKAKILNAKKRQEIGENIFYNFIGYFPRSKSDPDHGLNCTYLLSIIANFLSILYYYHNGIKMELWNTVILNWFVGRLNIILNIHTTQKDYNTYRLRKRLN